MSRAFVDGFLAAFIFGLVIGAVILVPLWLADWMRSRDAS